MWSVIGGLFAYSGWILLAASMSRHRCQAELAELQAISFYSYRLAGGACLAFSFIASGFQWGWAIGAVGWFGVLAASGLLFILCLSYWPRLAISPVKFLLARCCVSRSPSSCTTAR